MTKLKTLKDLDWSECGCDSFISNDDKEYSNHSEVDVDELKQEAIEDIKELKKIDCRERHHIIGSTTWSYSEEARNAIINYISWKFNISEEDLQDGNK